MADIISQLNLTEKELQDNKKELEEIVRLIDVIKSNDILIKRKVDLSDLDNQLVKLGNNLKKNFGDKWIDGLLAQVQHLSRIPHTATANTGHASWVGGNSGMFSSAERKKMSQAQMSRERELLNSGHNGETDTSASSYVNKIKLFLNSSQAGTKISEPDKSFLNNLKETETQAKKTEQAVRKVSEAELESDMRAALLAAHKYVQPDTNIEKKTEQIKEQGKHMLDDAKITKFNELGSLGYEVTDSIAKETKAVVDENKALEERSRLLAEGQKVAAERRMLLNGMERHMDRAKSMQSANLEAQSLRENNELLENKQRIQEQLLDTSNKLNAVDRLQNMKANLEKMPSTALNDDYFKGSADSVFKTIDEIKSRAENTLKSGDNEAITKLNNEVDLFEKEYADLMEALSDYIIKSFYEKKKELNGIINEIIAYGTSESNKLKKNKKEDKKEDKKDGEKDVKKEDTLVEEKIDKSLLKDESGNYTGVIMKELRIHDAELYKKIVDIIKSNDQIETEMGYHTQFKTAGFNEEGQKLNSSVQRAFGGKLNYNSDELNGDIEEKIAYLQSEIDMYTSYLDDDSVKDEAQQKINELTKKLNNLQNQLNSSVEKQFMGFIDMYNSTIGGLQTLKSDKVTGEIDYVKHEGSISKEGIKESRAIKQEEVQESKYSGSNEEEILKNIAKEKEKIINENKLINEQDIEAIYSEGNYNKLLKERQGLLNGIKREAELITGYESVKQEGLLLDENTTNGAKAIKAYNQQVVKGIEDAEKFINMINKTQSSLNTDLLPVGSFSLNSFQELQRILDSGYRVNLKGEDLERYKELEELINRIKSSLKDISYNGISDNIAVSQMQLNSLKSKDSYTKNFDAKGEATDRYKRTYDELQQVIREIQLLNSLKEQASENETTAKLFNVANIRDYDNALKYLNDKRDELGASLNKQENEFKKLNKEVPDLTNHVVELANALIMLGKNTKYVDDKPVKVFGDTIKDYEKIIKNVNKAQDKEYSSINNRVEKIQSQEAAKAAEDRERVLREEQTIRAKLADMQSKNQAKADADATKQWEEQVNKLRSKISEVTNYIKQAVANTVKVIRAANNVVNKSISVMIGAFDKLGSAVQRIIQLFGNFGNRVTGFNKQGNILKGTFTELKSKVDLLVGAFNKLYNNSFINEGKKLLSSVQTLNMLIGTELTTQTMEWATNLEHAFGLSAAGLISDLKELTAVMYGLGMTSQDVQVAATNLEAVAMSLSATTGYDFSTVVNKIQSGMKGMTQSIDDLGLSVRESQMDAFLKKLKAQGGEYANIGTSFSNLTEQQRIYVRYAAIMDQFTSKDAYSAENYAKSLRTITGSLSILNSQLRGLKSDIGSLALQLFAKIIQPLIYIIYLVRQAVAGLANLLGIDITLNPKINNSEDVVAPIEDVTDALDEEAAAADKAKGSLDSLDHVSTMSESKNSKKGDDFDYSSLMNISDDYAKLLEDLGKMQDDFIEECKEKFWKMVNDIKDKFTAWIKRITGRLIDWDAIKANWEIIKENLQKTWDNIVRIFKAGTDIIGGLLYSIFDDLDGTTLLAKLSEILEKFTRLIALILERVQPKIQAFYDKYVSKYVIKAGEKIKQVLDDVIAKLDEWIKWWEDPKNEGAINEWFENVGKKFESFMKTIKHIFIVFKSLVKGEGGLTLDERIETVDMSDGMKSMQEIAFSLHNILADVADVIKQVGKNLLDLNDDGVLNKDDLQIALDNIKEKLQDIEKWLDDNKEKIETLLTTAAETVGKLVGAKFDILMQLLEFITNNADTINGVLQTLQNVIKFVTEHPVLAATIAIGVQVAGHVIKGAATAAMWSTILGAGSIPEVFAGIAAAITGPIGIIIGILATAVAWFTLLWTKSEWFRGAVSSGIEEIKKCWDDNVKPIKDNLDEICKVLEDLGIDLDNLFWNDLMQLLYKDTLRGQIYLVKAAITLILSPLQAITGVLSGIFGLAKNIKQLFTDIKNFDFGDTLQNIAKVTGTGGLLGNKYVINGIKKVKSFYGNANGGVPSSGSLFLANENGNAELVGNFGGYTGVANQDMIIKAMQNAMVQAIKSAGGLGQSGSVVNNFNIGTMIGDDSSYRQLARKLNTINERSNSNIANVGFVMS